MRAEVRNPSFPIYRDELPITWEQPFWVREAMERQELLECLEWDP